VSDIKNLPAFNLRKEGVQVELVEWVGELDHFSELKAVWIQIEGIPPKWCDAKVFAQVASSFGLLIEVNWSSLFKSFYERVRKKIACRSPVKIPEERLFEMDKKLYMLSIVVEGLEHKDEDKSEKGGDDLGEDDEGNKDDSNEEGFDDLDNMQDSMDTKKGEGAPQFSVHK
jgi:hypothetical protein